LLPRWVLRPLLLAEERMSFPWSKIRCYYRKEGKGTCSNIFTIDGPLPKAWQNYMEQAGQLMSHIKTYDQETYEIQVEGDRIKIRKNDNVTS
jgi:hypothetical protein